MPSSNTKNRLIWIDIETTGLIPASDQVLEVAMVITDSAMNILSDDDGWAEYQAVVKPTFPITMDAVVTKMHADNGLLAVLDNGYPVQRVERECLHMIKRFGAENARLCGSTIHFDRSFLRQWMPTLESCFYYGHFDVSTMKAFWREILGGEIPDLRAVLDGHEHRAMPDILTSLAEGRFLMATIRGLLPEKSNKMAVHGQANGQERAEKHDASDLD